MPKPVTESVQLRDNQFLHPWEDMKKIGNNKRTVITHADGIYIEDSDGNKLLDGPAGMWCVNIGHRRQEMADAIADQIMQLTYASPWSLTNTPAVKLADKLAQLSPGDLNHVFYTTGGSTAVDSALRFVMFRNNVLEQPQKKHIISRTNAYHGSTYLSASASGKSRDKNYLDFMDDAFHHIADPNLMDQPAAMSEQEYCELRAGELENKILEIGADKVAAFIAEPIMASGGVIMAPQGYHAACLRICRAHDVVYISDEVVTAFGRLGHFFASQAVFDIVPDIITCAKGITSGYVPLGAFLVSDRLLQSIDAQHPSIVFSNGFTYSGHPVACAAALKNIEIMERENIMQHVRKVAPYFQAQLATLNELPVVTDVRGIGLMACVQCDLNKDGDNTLAMDYAIGDRIDRHCQQLGLLVRPIINMCVMSPPLIINETQIDELVEKLKRGIELAVIDAESDGL
ncbi:aminotransferase [Candidatus Spongiihabitans sp.]|uniref:aminotransferase n=1 Tax=Candidatus Spongiihabitans sp. TaxID=3101308 RepID=UPI003C7D8F09